MFSKNKLGYGAGIFAVTLLAILVVGEIVARAGSGSGMDDFHVDIQSPSHLKAKLNQIEQALHANENLVVLIGDSLWYGATMAEHGNKTWRDDTLDRALEFELNNKFEAPSRYRVVNLGMNGMLPQEMFVLANNMKRLGVPVVVFDIGLRSASKDFEPPDDYTRPWIKDLDITNHGEVSYSHEKNDILHKIGHAISLWASNNFELVNWRAQLRQYWFGGSPSALTTKIANSWKSSQTNGEGISPIVLLKAKQRYNSAKFAPEERVQVQAIVELLELSDDKFRAIPVYAVLNPDQIRRVIPKRKLQAHEALLSNLLEDMDQKTWFVGEIPQLRNESFLDLVHVDKAGYEAYAKAIAPKVHAAFDSMKTTK